MIIARQCMFIIIVIDSHFILKWCKIIFSCSNMRLTAPRRGMLDETLSCDLSLLICQRNNFEPENCFPLDDECWKS